MSVVGSRFPESGVKARQSGGEKSIDEEVLFPCTSIFSVNKGVHQITCFFFCMISMLLYSGVKDKTRM